MRTTDFLVKAQTTVAFKIPFTLVFLIVDHSLPPSSRISASLSTLVSSHFTNFLIGRGLLHSMISLLVVPFSLFSID